MLKWPDVVIKRHNRLVKIFFLRTPKFVTAIRQENCREVVLSQFVIILAFCITCDRRVEFRVH